MFLVCPVIVVWHSSGSPLVLIYYGPYGFCSFSENLSFHSFCQQTFGELLECARHSASHWVDSIKQDRSKIRVVRKAVEKSTIIESCVGEASTVWVQRRLLWA